LVVIVSFFLVIRIDPYITDSDPYKNYFAFKDVNDVEAHTERYHGCIVHISFWSKICAPCIRSFEKHRELREELINEGAIMINATIDNKDEWLMALERYHPNGLNIRPEKLQQVQRHFDIYQLPVYATLDIDGNLVTYSGNRKGDIEDFAHWYRSLD